MLLSVTIPLLHVLLLSIMRAKKPPKKAKNDQNHGKFLSHMCPVYKYFRLGSAYALGTCSRLSYLQLLTIALEEAVMEYYKRGL